MEHTKNRKKLMGLAALFLLAGIVAYNALYSYSYSFDAAYRNVSADARVNITDAMPEILTVKVTSPITLNAGSTRLVQCNATARDFNGGNTITNVSAVLWDNATRTWASADDNNDHYTNSSCVNTSVNGVYANFTCNITVWYYANNGSNWVCNVSINDDYLFNESVGRTAWLTNTTSINTLLALNVTPLIDYGNMAVGDTSDPIEANVTNYGNKAINVSVRGYGNTTNDGLAFRCDVGNISIANERFSLNSSALYSSFTSLNTTFTQIANLTLPQQTNDSEQVINNTYWRLYIPPNPFGNCNGTVVFQAEIGY